MALAGLSNGQPLGQAHDAQLVVSRDAIGASITNVTQARVEDAQGNKFVATVATKDSIIITGQGVFMNRTVEKTITVCLKGAQSEEQRPTAAAHEEGNNGDLHSNTATNREGSGAGRKAEVAAKHDQHSYADGRRSDGEKSHSGQVEHASSKHAGMERPETSQSKHTAEQHPHLHSGPHLSESGTEHGEGKKDPAQPHANAHAEEIGTHETHQPSSAQAQSGQASHPPSSKHFASTAESKASHDAAVPHPSSKLEGQQVLSHEATLSQTPAHSELEQPAAPHPSSAHTQSPSSQQPKGQQVLSHEALSQTLAHSELEQPAAPHASSAHTQLLPSQLEGQQALSPEALPPVPFGLEQPAALHAPSDHTQPPPSALRGEGFAAAQGEGVHAAMNEAHADQMAGHLAPQAKGEGTHEQLATAAHHTLHEAVAGGNKEGAVAHKNAAGHLAAQDGGVHVHTAGDGHQHTPHMHPHAPYEERAKGSEKETDEESIHLVSALDGEADSGSGGQDAYPQEEKEEEEKDTEEEGHSMARMPELLSSEDLLLSVPKESAFWMKKENSSSARLQRHRERA